MQADEARLGREAMAADGTELPLPARLGMKLLGRVMTMTAYRL
jgi:demethoxyubiquinone hydroxylase (CLK1/Coq7/Cat5 family)